ncbi:hypothetical protein SAMN04488595_10610 [Ralstonia sp. 25mfcol4.1]|nr:hypothetical protein SAMN04488595_10610 [Ralstonia sp. 25mfcol4.1]
MNNGEHDSAGLAVAKTGQTVPHLFEHLRIVLAEVQGLANPHRRQQVCACQDRSKFRDGWAAVLLLSAQQIGSCAKAGVPFDTTGQCMGKRLDLRMAE